MTRSYYDERLCVGTSEVERRFDPKGRRIAARDGEPLTALLAKKHAEIVRVPEPSRDDAPVAAPEWQIHAWGLHTAACPLVHGHALAAPPGENAFLLRLERVLDRHRAEVPTLLKEAHADAEKRGALLP